MKTNVDEIKSLNIDAKFQNTKKKVIELESKIEKETILRDELEQYGRRDNLEIHRIPVSPNENTNEIIKKVAQKLNVRLLDSDISTSHRIPAMNGKHPAITVKFSNRDKRNIFSNRKNLHGKKDYSINGVTTIYINENLTQRKRNLFAKEKLNKITNIYGPTMDKFILKKPKVIKKLKSTMKISIKLYKYCIKFNFYLL